MPNFEENKNVFGGDLIPCSMDPLTGFYRTGYCQVGPEDHGCHAVCCEMTTDFLAYNMLCGNDLTTPMPQHNFPGLKPGDRWCICASRWKQAYEAGYPCPVILEATSEAALKYVSLSLLEQFALVEKE